MSTPRGIANCNPGNIRRSRIVWRGQADHQTDPAFVRFITPVWGIRALGKLLTSYQIAHGLDTVTKIVDRFAPPGENATDAYVLDVAERCGVAVGDPINVADATFCARLVRALVIHENGECPYPDALILQGLKLAGITPESATH